MQAWLRCESKKEQQQAKGKEHRTLGTRDLEGLEASPFIWGWLLLQLFNGLTVFWEGEVPGIWGISYVRALGGIPWLVDRGGCLQRQRSKALSLPSALWRRRSRVGLLGTACRSLMARGGRIIKKASITYKVSKHKAVPNVLSG